MVGDIEGLIKQDQLPLVSFRSTLNKIYNNKMNQGANTTTIPKSVSEEIKKKYKRAFRGILRDIGLYTFDTNMLDDLMILGILMLRLIEECVYIFEDEGDLENLLRILLFLAIR